jgi:hypothetical protein
VALQESLFQLQAEKQDVARQFQIATEEAQEALEQAQTAYDRAAKAHDMAGAARDAQVLILLQHNVISTYSFGDAGTNASTIDTVCRRAATAK